MIADMSDRRVTRSLSNDLQARVAAHAHAQAPLVQSSIQEGYGKGLQGLNGEAEAGAKEPSSVYRNSSEEMFIKSLVEGSMGMSAPNMEGIGFTNLPQTMRGDSEELFHSWMSHNAEGQGSGPSQTSYRSRQSSRRMSNELAALLAQQNSQTFNRVDSFDQFLQTNLFFSDEISGDSNQLKSRNSEAEQGVQAADFSPLKSVPWFSQSRPMTRSHSSELRRRYAAMQGLPPPPSVDTFQRDHAQTIHELKQDTVSLEAISRTLANRRVNQPPLFPQVTQASLPHYNMPLLGTGDSVSTVVSMLKGTLERKKLGNSSNQHQQQRMVNDVYHPAWRAHEELHNMMTSSQFQVSNSSLQSRGVVQMQHEGYGQMQNAGQIYCEGQAQMEGPTSTGQIQPGLLSHAPSPSESSGGAPVLSTGEDPCNSGQTTSTNDMNMKRRAQHSMDVDQQPKRQNSIDNHPSPGLYGTGNCENEVDGIQKSDPSQKPNLTRMGSVTSSGGPVFTGDKEDPTKKRRVERQRKMAEAKGRNSIPMMPSDLQAALKRCDALEKEVRSLKLNLSFMNRKDSEQTKQIEELQKQNEELQEEKERLSEEIYQLTSGPGPG